MSRFKAVRIFRISIEVHIVLFGLVFMSFCVLIIADGVWIALYIVIIQSLCIPVVVHSIDSVVKVHMGYPVLYRFKNKRYLLIYIVCLNVVFSTITEGECRRRRVEHVSVGVIYRQCGPALACQVAE